jgi:hypothetical protein
MKRDAELAPLFSKVRKQEERNRLRVFIPFVILSLVLGANVVVAYLWHSQIVATLTFLCGVLALFCLRAAGAPSLTVSEVFVAQRLDSAFNLRGRISTLINLKEANDQERKLQREILERQIDGILSQYSCDEKEIVPFRSATLLNRTWMVIGFASACFLALLYFKPVSVYDDAVHRIEQVLKQNPLLPESVKKEAERLVATIENETVSVDDVLRAASKVASAIESAAQKQTISPISAIVKDSISTDGAKAAQNNYENDTASPTGKPESRLEAPDQKNELTPPQDKQSGESNPDYQQEQRADQQGDDEAEKKQGAGADQTGSRDSEEQKADQGPQKEEEGQKEGAQSEGGAEEQDSKENQDSGEEQGAESGDSQGSDKQENSAQAGAKQEGDGEGQGSGKGQGSEGQGQGEQDHGSSEGTEGMKGSASQGKGGATEGGNKNGEQGSTDQEQTSDGTSAKDAMNELQGAVSDLRETLEKEQQSKQAQDSKSSTDKGGATGEKEQSKADKTGGGDDSQHGSGEKDSEKDHDKQDASDGQNGNKSNKNDARMGSNNESEKNKGGTSDKEEKSLGEKSKDAEDSTSNDASSHMKEPEQSQQREAGENPSDGSLSPDVDRDAKPKPGGYDENKSTSGGLEGDPRKFKEIIREAEDERLNSDQATEDAQITENKEQARARTSLEDISLAKPKPSTQRESQPIPLEYRGVLDAE